MNTIKRAYISKMDLADAKTVMAQLPEAFEPFSSAHPQSSLKMNSAAAAMASFSMPMIRHSLDDFQRTLRQRKQSAGAPRLMTAPAALLSSTAGR